jgi:hypothetical protein
MDSNAGLTLELTNAQHGLVIFQGFDENVRKMKSCLVYISPITASILCHSFDTAVTQFDSHMFYADVVRAL